MSGFAGFTYWENKPVDSKIFSKMMQMIKHRGPDGHQTKIVNNIAFGHALLALKKNEYSHRQPLFFPDNSAIIVGDIHLYNRDEILDTLGKVKWFKSYPSNAAIILECYKRFGSEFLNLLNGDFAFAIWDFNKNTLFAAKDPFGIKPFFYYYDRKKILFCSEIKQILSTSLINVQANDELVGEFLFDKFENLQSTFYNDIYRLKPSHYLIANSDKVEQIRYWRPDLQKEVYRKNPSDYLDNFKELFKNSVKNRIQTDFPVCADLSGGLDSSSIVAVLAEYYNSSESDLHNLQTISSLYGNLDCDESKYINSIIKRIPFKSHLLNPLKESLVDGLANEIWQTDTPFADIQRGSSTLISKTINNLNARVEISGIGGDELLNENLFLIDLVYKKQYIELFKQTWKLSEYSWCPFYKLLWDNLKISFPRIIKNSYRLFIKRKPWLPPIWANKEFCKKFVNFPEISQKHSIGFESLTQEHVYKSFMNGNRMWDFEFLEAKKSYNNIEIRYPFADKKLVEFILSIPFGERRINGRWKYFLRNKVSTYMPDKILDRKLKTGFNSFIYHVWSKEKDKLKEFIFSNDVWHSGKYVNKNNLELLFDKPVDEKKNISLTIMPIWNISTLEIWNRQLSHYNLI